MCQFSFSLSACSSIINLSWLQSRSSPCRWKCTKLGRKSQAKKNDDNHDCTSIKQNRSGIRRYVAILHWRQPRNQSVSLKKAEYDYELLIYSILVAQFQCLWCRFSSSLPFSCFTFGANSPRLNFSSLQQSGFLCSKGDLKKVLFPPPHHQRSPVCEFNSTFQLTTTNHRNFLFLFIN
jgi:hypothetical protein